jgi:hypothetical protein
LSYARKEMTAYRAGGVSDADEFLPQIVGGEVTVPRGITNQVVKAFPFHGITARPCRSCGGARTSHILRNGSAFFEENSSLRRHARGLSRRAHPTIHPADLEALVVYDDPVSKHGLIAGEPEVLGATQLLHARRPAMREMM